MRSWRTRVFGGLTALALLAPSAGEARADLTLTQAGLDRGLTLTTFATGFPSSSGIGPLGIAFPASGGVLVSDWPGNVRLFATDTDGQLASNAHIGQSYGLTQAKGMDRSVDNIYMAQQGSSQLVQINNDGTFNRVIVGGMPGATGVLTNPNNGNLFVSTVTSNQVWQVNPVAMTKTLFVNANLDGMTTDGAILYGANNSTGHLLGYRISDGALVFDSGFVPGGIDGSALGADRLAGNIYVNTNAGTVVEVNLATGQQTLIATGGSRGDFVTIDPTNNTLLLTQTDRILRLNGPFGFPEPSTFTLGSLGALGLLGYCGRRRLKKGRPEGAPADKPCG
jgi:hypothetical protein